VVAEGKAAIKVPALELASTEARLSAEASSAKTGSAAHSATKVRSAAHSATVPALSKRAGCHRRAKCDRRRNNKYYFTHERSSFWRCCNVQDDAGAVQQN
jgi:hypothetical protein